MAQELSETRPLSVDQLETIICSDLHLIENLDQLLPYMDDEFTKRQIQRTPVPEINIYSFNNGGPVPQGHDIDHTAQGTGADDPVEKIVSDMNEFDLDYGLLSPTLNLQIATVNNDRHAVALCQAYNSLIADKFIDGPEGALAAIVVPPQAPHKAAEMIDDWADEDIAAVHTPPSSLAPPIGNERYDAILEATERSGLPLCLHGGHASYTFALQTQYSQTHPQWQITNFSFSLMWHFTSLMFEGVPRRFPDLKMVLTEAGIGWVPYTLFRMDDVYLEEADVLPHLEKLPSEYVEDRFYFSTQPLGHTPVNHDYIAKVMEWIGTDSVLYSSDLPHHDFDPPSEVFNRIRGQLDDDEVKGVMGENAAELFGVSS